MPFAALLVATLVSAVLYGLSFPPTAWRALMWVAIAPFLVALRRAPLGRAVFLAWLWLTVMAYAVGDWFPRAVASYYEQSLLVGFGFFFGVSTFMAGIYYMAFAPVYRRLAQRPGAFVPLYAAAAWVAGEIARVRLLTGDPWALSGYSQVGVDAAVQIADVTGVYGISFAVVAVNAALAELWLARGAARDRRRQAAAGAVAAAVVVGGVLAYGLLRLRSEVHPGGAGTTRVAVVQGNLDLGSQWRQEFYGQNLDVYLRLTERALRGGRPAVVFWPENALTFFLDNEPAYRGAIGTVLATGGAQLVSGGPRFEGTRAPVYYNSAFLLSPQGHILARYDKEHLLPFAEYFPVARLDFLRRRFGRVREFSPGGPTPPLPTAAGAAGVLICNEGMFAEIAAARVRAGAGYLLNLSNDTWLGEAKFSQIVFDTVALRAVEQRRYLVRSSTSGPSAIVDPAGRVRAATAPFSRAVISGAIEARDGLTIYNRVGDLFAFACAGIALLASAVAPPRHGGRPPRTERAP